MTRTMRTLHKWVALVLALQFVAWMASGLALSLIDHHAANGEPHRRPAEAPTRPWPVGVQSPVQVVAASRERVQRIESAWLQDRPVYRLVGAERTWLLDAASGEPVTIDALVARALASADYVGDAPAAAPEWLEEAPREAIEHAAPLWRVRFTDDVDTTLYVSAVDGRILERRNAQSRWFELFWMLHTMDYSGRGNFNHPLVIVSAAGGLFAALTGVWLLVALLRRRRPRAADAAA
jgi:Na+-transporting NADH:ubiquinone oxidoreductase subunit F